MLTLTNEARSAITTLTTSGETPRDAGVRIAATSSLDGAAPALNLALADAPEPGDQVMDQDGARVFLDSEAASALDGQTLDAQIDTEAQQVNFFVA